jgi:acyl-CoA reductase-like NAD-dependent aldehyde dehydrogenase
VIAIACPDEYPLLGFVSLVAPAVVRANTIVIVPSEKYPLSATDLYQVELNNMKSCVSAVISFVVRCLIHQIFLVVLSTL